MSSLNITPNPKILLVQAVIFLTTTVVIKFLFLDSFKKLKRARLGLTTGSADSARTLIADCERMSKGITEQLGQAYQAAKALREKAKADTSARRAEITAAAEKRAKDTVGGVVAEIQKELSAAKQQLPEHIQKLSQDILAKALK